MLGADGFETALKGIIGIERDFGLSDLVRVTTPAPPTA